VTVHVFVSENFVCFQHRDTPENNPSVPFEFTPENLKVMHVLIYLCFYTAFFSE